MGQFLIVLKKMYLSHLIISKSKDTKEQVDENKIHSDEEYDEKYWSETKKKKTDVVFTCI